MGGFIAILLKYLPTILAILSALFGGGVSLNNHLQWSAHVAAASAGGLSAPDPSVWWEYVFGPAAGGTTLAGILAMLQPIATRAVEGLYFEQLLKDISDMPTEKKKRIRQAAD